MSRVSSPHSELRNKILGELRRDPVDVVAVVQALDDLVGQLEALRVAVQRGLHELDQWVLADGTASYRVERAEAILNAALEGSNPANSLPASGHSSEVGRGGEMATPHPAADFPASEPKP